ncbi:MAG: putative DNA binding domain-containing protein [Candidatus Aminicenantes bacterium]|nr:putative DNA binding domain-containing protein [Candidatus Aminicenantes bacterium]
MAKKLQLIESESVELKTSLAERQEILETISAFSNTIGGTIYIGVEPGGEVSGVDIGNRTIENLANEIKQNTDPKVFPTIEIREINGKEIIVIKAAEYPAKPVWVKDKVFLRVGRSNQRASAEKIRQLIYENKVFKWDSEVQPKLKLSDINTTLVKSFLQKVEEERNTIFESSRSTAKVLEKLNLIEDNHLRNAALLLFGKNPQKYFVQSEIRCAKFNGTEPIEFADIQVIRGTIIEQVPDVLGFIRRHISVAAQITGEAERKETWEYPKEALREAVINAVCHRSYEDTGNVQVRIFDDRLEVWSPGSLPGNITVEMLKKDHRSTPRNELIARCFYLIKYIEQWGTGTNRMIKLCKEAGLPEPEFLDREGSVIVIFKRKPKRKKNIAKLLSLFSLRDV